MSAYPFRGIRLALSVTGLAALAACSSLDGASGRLVNAVTPYRIEVVQGNFLSKEQVDALQAGMSRQQVRDILGTPLLASVFHADRWDYVFTLRRQGVEPQSRRLSVFFEGDNLVRFEGDEMPSEAEFVARLDSRRKNDKVPVLEASEEALSKYPPPQRAAARASEPAAANTPIVYPPLEPSSR